MELTSLKRPLDSYDVSQGQEPMISYPGWLRLARGDSPWRQVYDGLIDQRVTALIDSRVAWFRLDQVHALSRVEIQTWS